MGRSPCCSKEGLNRGAWTAMEDRILTDYIKVNGEGKWRNLPKRAGLKRCGKSCRLRWLNYLRPDIKRGNITRDEEDLIIRLHKLLGNRWSLIAGRLPGRTDNEIKNYWNTNIGKKLVQAHPIPTSSNRKPSNQRSVLDPSSPSIKSCVVPVRAKPSRFTKVFITSDPQNKHQIDHPKPVIAAVAPSETRSTDFDGAGRGPNPPYDVSPAVVSAADDPSDFLIDFEMDDKFLSDILNTEFLPLYDADRGDNTGSSSPNSSGTLLFSDDLLHNSNLQSMTPLHGFGADWIEDQ